MLAVAAGGNNRPDREEDLSLANQSHQLVSSMRNDEENVPWGG